MNRTERRALAHKERKLARKLARAAETQNRTLTVKEGRPTDESVLLNIPGPGGVFPPLSAITPSLQPHVAFDGAAHEVSATDTPTTDTPGPSPISTAQLAANRANSLKSSGPKTEAGLATSSQNRTTHGLARHNGTFRLLSTEDSEKFEQLKSALETEHHPETETESILVNAMAESTWLSQRAANLIDTTTDPDSGAVTDPKLFNLYMRYQTTHTRSFHKSLNDLLKLRKEIRTEQNGFEAQNRAEALLNLKLEKHEMKKQGHYWDILLKDGKAMHQLTINLNARSAAARENPGFEAQFAAELAQLGLKQHPKPVDVPVAAA